MSLKELFELSIRD